MTGTLTYSPTVTFTELPPEPPDDSLSGAAIAGISAAATVGAMSLAGAGAAAGVLLFAWLRRRRRRVVIYDENEERVHEVSSDALDDLEDIIDHEVDLDPFFDPGKSIENNKTPPSPIDAQKPDLDPFFDAGKSAHFDKKPEVGIDPPQSDPFAPTVEVGDSSSPSAPSKSTLRREIGVCVSCIGIHLCLAIHALVHLLYCWLLHST